jgi:hypothetical protein
MAEEQEQSLDKQIANLSVRLAAKYRGAKDVEEKMNLNTAFTLLAIAQGSEKAAANILMRNAKIIAKA